MGQLRCLATRCRVTLWLTINPYHVHKPALSWHTIALSPTQSYPCKLCCVPPSTKAVSMVHKNTRGSCCLSCLSVLLTFPMLLFVKQYTIFTTWSVFVGGWAWEDLPITGSLMFLYPTGIVPSWSFMKPIPPIALGSYLFRHSSGLSKVWFLSFSFQQLSILVVVVQVQQFINIPSLDEKESFTSSQESVALLIQW